MKLQVNKISKRFGQKWALRGVELEVSEGTVLGVFGGNASGKTSLLRCIAGEEKLDGGSVELVDSDGTVSAAKDRCILMSGTSRSSGFSSLLGRGSGTGSGGEMQLAELSRALSAKKDLLLLDDPLLTIGTREREDAIRGIRAAADGGKIVVLGSSTFDDIALVCDIAAVIVNGEIVQTGTPQQVYERPESVAAVIGRLNLIAARRLSSSDAELPEFLSIEGGHRLFAHQTEKSRLGAINQTVTLAIRPEQVSISFGASFPEDNLLKAVVAGIRFHGDTTLIELDASGLKIEARVFKVVGLEIGEECMISLPPDRLLVLRS